MVRVKSATNDIGEVESASNETECLSVLPCLHAEDGEISVSSGSSNNNRRGKESKEGEREYILFYLLCCSCVRLLVVLMPKLLIMNAYRYVDMHFKLGCAS